MSKCRQLRTASSVCTAGLMKFLRFLQIFPILQLLLLTSLAYAENLSPRASDLRFKFQEAPAAWQITQIYSTGIVLKNPGKGQYLLINEIPTTLSQGSVESYLNKGFKEGITRARSQDFHRFGFHPSFLEVKTMSWDHHVFGNISYDMPGEGQMSTVVERVWGGRERLWHMTMIFDGTISLKADVQNKIGDEIMAQIISQDEGRKHSALEIFKTIFGENSAVASEVVKSKNTKVVNSPRVPSSDLSFWRPITVEECRKKRIAPEKLSHQTPLTFAPFTKETMAVSCPTGVGDGVVNLAAQMEVMPFWNHLAELMNKRIKKNCHDAPQIQPHESPVDFHVRSNKWNDCVLQQMPGAGFDQAGELARFGFGLMSLYEHEITLAVTDPTQIADQITSIAAKFSKWFWSKKNPLDALVLFCRETDGIACLTKEYQTEAMCSCLGGISATLAAAEIAKLAGDVEKSGELFDQALRDGRRGAMAAEAAVSAELIEAVVKKSGAASHAFIKDTPVFGFKIPTDAKGLKDIPASIRAHLGAIDKTVYTDQYIRENAGSVIMMQMKSGEPDFYVIGREVFEKQYKVVANAEVAAKNAKYFSQVSPHLPEGAEPVAILKTSKVQMIKMSDAGYPIEREVTIESPWGTQTKPAGVDAHLVWDEGAKKYYMVNVDTTTGLPIGYVPAKH